MALKWTKTSLDPSEGAMKPKPLSSLNHLTVPVAITVISGEIERVFVQGNVERFQEKLPRRTERGATGATTRKHCTTHSFPDA
jgi:hypothetical protein